MNKPKLKKNPFLAEEIEDYLIANGFRKAAGLDNHNSYFFKDGIAVTLKPDAIEFAELHEEEPDQCSAGYYKYMEVSGINSIDTMFDFMLLFHVAKVVTLKSLRDGAMKQGVVFRKDDFMDSIMKHFQITDDHNAIPLNY